MITKVVLKLVYIQFVTSRVSVNSMVRGLLVFFMIFQIPVHVKLLTINMHVQ